MHLTAVAAAVGIASFTLGWAAAQPAVRAADRQANTDPLTGLGNRAALRRHLNARTRARQPYTILMLDLDGFKPVNDTYGHAAGDELLIAVAHRLRLHLPYALAVRLGGDEFVLVAEAGLDTTALVRQIHGSLTDPVRLPGVVLRGSDIARGGIQLAGSVGAARADRGADWEAVLHQADLAMLQAKQAGPAPGVTTGLINRPNPRARDINRKPWIYSSRHAA